MYIGRVIDLIIVTYNYRCVSASSTNVMKLTALLKPLFNVKFITSKLLRMDSFQATLFCLKKKLKLEHCLIPKMRFTPESPSLVRLHQVPVSILEK